MSGDCSKITCCVSAGGKRAGSHSLVNFLAGYFMSSKSGCVIYHASGPWLDNKQTSKDSQKTKKKKKMRGGGIEVASRAVKLIRF